MVLAKNIFMYSIKQGAQLGKRIEIWGIPRPKTICSPLERLPEIYSYLGWPACRVKLPGVPRV